MIFKVPLSGGGLILPLSFPQALSREFRVHWRGGRARSADRPEMEPGPVNSFFRTRILTPEMPGKPQGPLPLEEICKTTNFPPPGGNKAPVVRTGCLWASRTVQWEMLPLVASPPHTGAHVPPPPFSSERILSWENSALS